MSQLRPLKPHRALSAILPPLTPEETKRAIDRVAKYGQAEQIAVVDGQIVSGWDEYGACIEAGVAPKLTRIPEPECIADFVVRHGIPRELDFVARGCIAVLYYEQAAKQQAHARKVAGARLGGTLKGKGTSVKKGHGSSETRWTVDAAKMVGVRPGTVRTLAHLRKNFPDLFDALRARRIMVLRDAIEISKHVESVGDRAKIVARHHDGTRKVPLVALMHDSLRKNRIEQLSPASRNGRGHTLYAGSMEEHSAKVPDNSVDLIFADVVFGVAGRDMVAHVAEIGARILVPGGLCAIMAGHIGIDAITPAVSKYLTAVAVGFIHYKGGSRLGRHANLVQRVDADPILFFAKGKRLKRPITHLVYESSAVDKAYFAWQKPLDAMMDLVVSAVGKGAVVLDPCCGSGTTGEATLRLGGRFVGIDIDAERIRKVAAPRLAQVERELAGGRVRPFMKAS